MIGWDWSVFICKSNLLTMGYLNLSSQITRRILLRMDDYHYFQIYHRKGINLLCFETMNLLVINHPSLVSTFSLKIENHFTLKYNFGDMSHKYCKCNKIFCPHNLYLCLCESFLCLTHHHSDVCDH